MRHKLQTKEGKKRYALRKQTPEPVFGIIKSVIGFRQFMLRGLDKVRGEWSLVTMAWNMQADVRPGGGELSRNRAIRDPFRRVCARQTVRRNSPREVKREVKSLLRVRRRSARKCNTPTIITGKSTPTGC